MRLDDVSTPAFVIERATLERNLERMRARAERLGVTLRAHQKTTKCAEIARRAVGPGGPITVSTAKEARYFAAAGFRDITLAVGITASRVGGLHELARNGASLGVVLDATSAVANMAGAWREQPALGVHIEIDCGGRRGGVSAAGEELLEIAAAIRDADGLTLVGVLTHAGQSYHRSGLPHLREIAEIERAAAVGAATRLREAGFACERVSVGSTPTAVAADSLEGVTEMRPGVYALFDLYQEALGACERDDIAGSVVASVIGHHEAGHALIDAGSLALSLDRGPKALGRDTGFGLVTALDGSPIEGDRRRGCRVVSVHQEHGLVEREGDGIDAAALPIGSKVRILPNHACMTAAPHATYVVVDGTTVVAEWDSCTGW